VSVAGIILAGGASRRMGSPKALLRMPGPEGETFLDRLIGVFSACCAPVVVVLGHEPQAIRAGLARAAQAEFVINRNYERGQLSSLQCGLRALSPHAGGVLFTPVDYPAITAETAAKVARAVERRVTEIAIPRCGGRHGHPVACAAGLIPEFLALPGDGRASDVIHAHASDTLYIDVDDPGVLEDVDDPEAYQRLIRAAEAR
jgi:molybdenum cofactor cytidylyltransferase